MDKSDPKPEQTDNRDRKSDPKQTVSQDPFVDYSKISDHKDSE